MPLFLYGLMPSFPPTSLLHKQVMKGNAAAGGELEVVTNDNPKYEAITSIGTRSAQSVQTKTRVPTKYVWSSIMSLYCNAMAQVLTSLSLLCHIIVHSILKPMAPRLISVEP